MGMPNPDHVRSIGWTLIHVTQAVSRYGSKCPPFCRRHIQIHFADGKLLYFDSNSTEEPKLFARCRRKLSTMGMDK